MTNNEEKGNLIEEGMPSEGIPSEGKPFDVIPHSTIVAHRTHSDVNGKEKTFNVFTHKVRKIVLVS
jgi:hypothetical protein